ncbi:MAG: DUF6713 family protein [Pseudomonadota bacterium]
MKDILFYLGLALLLTHEMDAMLNHEWLVLPLTSFLTDPKVTCLMNSLYFSACPQGPGVRREAPARVVPWPRLATPLQALWCAPEGSPLGQP